MTVDVSTIVVTDAANITGTLAYFGTASDAVNNANALTSTIISASQTVWIRKTDMAGLCFDTVSVVVTINPKPVIADAAVTICAPLSVDLTASIANYATIVNPTWTVGSLTGTAVTTPSKVDPSVSTTYFLVGENATGCKDTAEVAVTVNPKPALGADQTLVCSGITAPTTYDFVTTGTYVILSQPATAAASVSGAGAVTNMTLAGQYTFEITAANGCKDTASITIPTCLPTAVISNAVWDDANNDGIQQPTEAGIPNVKVDLYKFDYTLGDYVLLTTQNTGVNGNYAFNGLDSGKYYVKLPIIPSGMVSSTGDGVSDVDGAGAFEPSTSTAPNTDKGSKMGTMIVTAPINLAVAQVDTIEKFGLYTPEPIVPALSLGNLVFEDKNNNGVYDLTDVGIENVEVILFNIGLDGLKNTADDVVIDTLLTDPNGNYAFTGLDTGRYFVKLNGGIPSGMVSSTGNGVTDISGVGTYEPSTSVDVNNADNGVRMGMMVMSNIITLTLYGEPTNDGDTSSLTNLTVDFGLYTPQPIIPTLSLGDLVWNDANNDGIHQSTEGGIQDVRVVLYGVGTDGFKNTTDDVTIDSILTNGSGNYLFTGLSAGDYFVKLSSGIPAGMVSSTGDGVNDIDGLGTYETTTPVDVNDADNGTQMGTMVMSKIVTLSLYGEPTTDGDTSTLTNLTVDFGLYTPVYASIGNLVFIDANNDGIRQNTEGSLPNVNVELYKFNYATSTYDLFTAQLTGPNGQYLFNTLDSGKYYVKIPVIPAGYSSSTGDGPTDMDGAGTFEPSSSAADNTDKGSKMGTMIVSVPFTLAQGTADTTVDFGFYVPQFIVCDCPTRQDTLAPVLANVPANATVECSAVPNIATTVTASDNCPTAPTVTATETRTNGSCLDTYILTRVWTATDACGNTATAAQILTVRDGTVPALAGVPANVTVNCDAVPLLATNVTASDNCDLAVTITSDEVRTNGVCPNTYTLTRIWTATDNCNNTATLSQVIAVQDTTKPALVGVPTDVTLACGETTPTVPTVTATDNCNGTPTLTFAETTPNATTIVRTWTAMDACGNVTTAAQTITKATNCPVLTASIGNLVFNDANNDGIRQNTEGSLPNVNVELYKFNYTTSTYDLVTSQLTGPNGQYLFNTLDSGKYYVKIPVIPAGLSSSTGNGVNDFSGAGAFEPSSSTADNTDKGSKMGTMVVSNPFNLPQGAADTTVDFGFYAPQAIPTLSLGNLVWNDANNDGIHQNTEGGIANVRIVLYGVGTDGLKNTADDVKVDSILSSGTGNYLFAGLSAGNYYVKLSSGIPSGMVSSTGDGVNDTDGAGSFEPSTSVDINDLDNGTAMGTMVMSKIIALSLYGEPTNDGDTSSLTNLSVDFGLYTPVPIVVNPTLSLGNSVFNDDDNDGLQGFTEVGIPNVRTVLYAVGADGLKNTADDVKLDSVLTSSNGNYLFTGLNPGQYYVKLSSGIPVDMVSSTGEGQNDVDGMGPYEPSTTGDINEADHGTQMGTMIMSGIVNLTLYGEPTNDGDTSSNTNLTVDFGLYTPRLPNATLTIGNLVWNDANNDGIHQAGESGISGVLVVLYNVGGDNQKNTADDFVVTNTTTDTAGKYTFPLLSEGNYYVKLNGGIPSGMVSSTGGGIADTDGAGSFEPSASVDINDVDNGTVMGTMIMSNMVVLRAYSEPTNDGDLSSNTNLSVDFGLYTPNALSSSVGNLVWNDANNDGIRQNTEGSLPNVDVTLFKFNTTTSGYDFVNTIQTDANGNYLFSGLTAGQYYVKVPTIPAGMNSSTGNGAGDMSGAGTYEPSTSTADNSDRGSKMGTMVVSVPFTLTLGQVDTTVDFGFYTPSTCDCALNQDRVAPVLAGVPSNTTLNCNATMPTATVTATDNCATVVPITLATTRANGVCASNYTLTRTWTATDLCGNTATASQTIVVQDIAAPTFANVPVNLTLTCGQAVPTAATPSATDLCDGNPVVTMAQTTPTATTIVRTWTATDACGNSATTAQTITTTPCKLSLGDLVFNDANNDGLYQNTEGGIQNVRVVLYGVGADGAKNTADDVKIDSVLTSSTGNYLFTNLDAGDYFVKLSSGIPSGMVSSTGDGVADTDGAGAFEPAVANDVNNRDNGAQMGTMVMSNIITLTYFGEPTNDGDTSSLTNLTIDFGLYTPVRPVATVGNLVWNDANNDGIRQNTEGSIPNVSVELYKFDFTTSNYVLVTSQMTDPNGKYAFTGLDSGQYYVKLPVIPAGMSSSTGGGPTDNDGAGTYEPATLTADNGDRGTKMGTMIVSNPFVITLGQVDTTVDFGLYVPQSLTCDCATLQDVTAPTLVGLPTNTTLNCQDLVPTGSDVTATDNCAPNVAVVITNVTINGICAANYTISRTWTATDLCGNVARQTRTIIVQDVTAPTLAAAPANVTVNCNAVPTAATLTAKDTCTANQTVVFAETRVDGNCASNYTLTRTWTATDGCNNSATVSQLVTVQDVTAPILANVPVNTTINCDQTTAGTPTATDLCGGTPTISMVETRVDGTCAGNYTLTRTWTAADVCGNTATASQIITVRDTTRPVLVGVPANTTLACGVSAPTAPNVTATDNCGTATVASNEISSATLIIRTWTATDACGNTATASQTMTLTPCPKATIGNLVFTDANNDGIRQNTEGSLPNVKVDLYRFNYTTSTYDLVTTQNTDVNGKYLFDNLDSGRYYVKLPIIPAGMSSSTGNGVADLTGAGAFEPSTSTADNTDRGTKMGTMVVSNPFNISVGQVDTTVDFGFYTPVQPRLALSLGNIVWSDTNNDGIKDTNETGLDGVTVVLFNVGNDGVKNTADDQFIDSLTTGSGGQYLFTGLDEGKYFVKLTGTGVPTGFVSSTGGGVADNDGAGSSEPSTSNDVNDRDNGTQMGAMVMSNIINLTYYGEPTNDGDTSSLTNLTVDFGLYKPIFPQGALGNLVWNDANNDGIYQNTEGSLPNVKVDLYKFNYTTSTYDLVTTLNTDANGKYLFNGLDSGRYYVKLPTIPTGMSSSTGGGPTDNSGVGTYEPSTSTADNADRGTKMGTMVVSNPFVLATNQVDTTVDFGFYVVQSIACDCPTRQDTIAPSLVGVPANVTVNCQTVVTPPNVTAVDNCAAIPTVTMADVTVRGTCIGNYRVTRTWTATDACGNTSTASQIITVQDVTPPTFTNVPANVTVSCSVVVTSATAPTAVDSCDQSPRITFVETRQNGTCVSNYTLTRVWTATDACGNSASASQVVTVRDIVAPTFANVPVNLTLTCGQTVPTAVNPTATDSCDANPTVTMVQTTPTATTIVRTWTATDGCGNSATTSQTITTPTNCNTPTAAIGNLVWNDSNNDGIRQNTEGSLPNVKVDLYKFNYTTGVFVLVTTQNTDANGKYLFNGLDSGRFYVKLPTIPTGMSSSTGGGPTDNSGVGAYEPSTSTADNSDRGTKMGTMVVSNSINIGVGQVDTTVDFGFYTPVPVLPKATIGNLVWNDANNDGIHQNTEGSLSSVKVDLYKFNYTTGVFVLATTQNTDANGKYLFNGLDSGRYYVKLPTIPTGMSSSTGDGVSDTDGAGAFEPSTSTADNADRGTKMGTMVVSNPINIAVGQVDTTVDFGFYTPVASGTFDLALTKKLVPRTGGVVVNNGDVVRFRMTIANQGSVNARDIKIKDYIPSGLQFILSQNTAALTGNANDWAADSTLFINDLNAGATVTADIILTVNHLARDTFFLNKSEVIFATDTEGSLVNTTDVDSRADSNPNNDVVGGDNVVNNNRNDEDDHDIAYVIDYPNKDPIGYIYCDKTGKILMGGTISVTGPGIAYIIEDGSNGRYQFFTDGTPGTYTMTYTHPDGFPMSTICAARPGALNLATSDGTAIDRDGVRDGFTTIGTSAVANGFLVDKTCANNPYYLSFTGVASTDAEALHNNIPVQCSFIGAITCSDNNANSIRDAVDTPLSNVTVYLYNCLTNALLDSTISVNGKYSFDGLRSGSYRVRAVTPNNYRLSIANLSNNSLLDSRLDANGFSDCMVLNFGECDTAKGNVCFIPQIFDLALRKTLAVGQATIVNVGDTINYTVQVFNQGTVAAYDVDVVDYIPTGMQLVDPTWRNNGAFAAKRIAGPIAMGGNTSVNIKLKVTGTDNQYVNFAEISRASDRVGGANVPDTDSQADSTATNDRGGRWNVVGENDNITGGINGDEDDSDPAVISVNNVRNGCGIALNPNFTTRGACATEPTQFTVTTTGFTAYAWNFGDGTLGAGSTVSHQYTAVMGGTFDVTLFVTNNNGCSDSITKQVAINPMVWANAGLDRTICAGESVELTAQGGTHYAWLPAATLNNAEIFNPIARPTVTTTYYVLVSNDFGCSARDSVTVTVNPQPRILSRTGTVSTCSNGVMPIRIQLDQSITNYQITGSAGYSNVVVSGGTITFNATLNGALNNMSVLLTGNNGCTIRDTFNLILAGNPRADFVVIEPFCNNAETTLLFTGSATAAARLTYALEDGVIVRQSAATATRPFGDTTVVRFPTFGSKLLKLNVNDGGCTADATKSIFVRKSPKTVLANKDTTICPGVCVPLYGTAGILDCVYTWSPATGLSSTNTASTIACPLVTTTYTLTIMDINGCSSSMSVTITVTPPPVLVGVPANVTVECNSVPSPATTVRTTTGLPVAFNEVRTAGNCPNAYTLTRTWTATNSCNLTTTGTQIVTVRDATAPVLANVPRNITMSCDATLPTTNGVTATDNCDANPLIASNSVRANGTCANNYTITRTWIARDACNNTATAAQVISVQDLNAPMLMNVPMNTTLSCDAALPSATVVTAMDNCDAAPRVTFADVRANGYCPNSYTLARTWTATDACGNSSTASQVIIVLDLTKPVLANVPANTTIECNATPATPPTVTASDNCDASLLRVVFAEKRANNACGYTLTRTWTAIDACGNAGTGIQVITAEDRTAPSFGNTPPTVTIDCIEKLNTVRDPSVSDACDPNPRVTVAQSVTDSTCANRKKIIRLYSAKDICGNTQLFTQTINVFDNVGPVITPRNPLLAGLVSGDTLTMSCEDIRLFQLGDATAVDNCLGCTPTLTFVDVAVKRGTCPIDGYSLLMECLWTATDCCGNKTEWRIFIKVTDNKAPELTGVPANITVNSPAQVPAVPVVTATDNCTDSVGVTFTQTLVATGTNCDYIITRTWTALDACGNVTRRTQQIFVKAPPLDIKAVKTDETCAKNDGTITMIPSSGITYIWSDGARGAFRTGLKAGSYTVTASAGLCTETVTVIILDGCICPIPVIANISKTDATCGNSNGSVTVTVDNPALYTFIWSSNATGTGLTRSNLAVGFYSVTVTKVSDASCSRVVSIGVANNTANCCTQPIATVVKADATCGGSNGSAKIVVDNAANYTFTWSSNAPTGTGDTRSNLAAGTYSVTVARINDAACSTVVTTTIINNTANCCTQPVATITKVDATCGDANGTATIAVDNAANYTFTWSSNSPLGSGITRSNLATGTYSVTVSRIADATCLTVVTTTIANNTANCCVTPIATVTKVDATCGDANGSATVAVDNAANYTFTWSSNVSAGTGATRSNLAAGTYSVTVARINNATCSTIASVVILNNTANCCTTPIATVTKNDATCGGSNGSASIAVDNVANYTFTWSANAPAGTGASRSGLAEGTYSVTVSRTALPTCLTVSTIVIANNTGNCCTPPLAVVTKADATCSESNGTASVAVVDGAANYVFTWSANASTATGTGAARTNLAAGTYSITVSRVANPTCLSIVTAIIANNTEGCCNIIQPTSIVKTLTDCVGKADVCVEIAPNRLANYTITNNGAAYTGGFGTCQAGSTLSLAVGQHRLIFRNNVLNCNDTLDVKVACVREMSASRNIQLPATNDYCLTPADLRLTGTIVSVLNECAASADNTQITINSATWCVSYKGLTVGLDTACLKITTSTGDVANMKLFIKVTSAMPFNFINQDSVIVTNACTDSTKVCVNIPFSMIGDYQIRSNGADYTGALEGCNRDTLENYDLSLLTRNGAVGPYNLNSWTVNGTTYSALNISSLQALVDTMNRINPTGLWFLNSTNSIALSSGRGNTYSDMNITIQNGALVNLGLNIGTFYRGTNLTVQRGRTYLSFANRLSGLADTMLVNAACMTPQRIETTMLKGKTDTFCIDTRQLLGTRYRIATLTTSTGRFVNYSNLAGTTCVNRAALSVGTERITYTVSDEYGMADTIYVTTHVTESALLARRPIAANDKATTNKLKPVYIDIMTNDSIFTNRGAITIIKEPKRGTAIVMSDFRILYTPNADYCNISKPDVLTYTVCNQAGCDTATVEVTVLCDKIKVYNGFSPNNDGVNDFFMIEGAELFSKNTLTIYNRWGSAVLDTKGYKNDWSGNWDGKAVPDGTYFYIFNDGEGNQISGYIQIQR